MSGSLDRFFFRGGSAVRLGITRCLFYAWYGWTLFRYQPLDYPPLPTDLWDPPLLLEFFPAPSEALLSVVLVAVAVTTALSCFGLFTRVATSATALLGTFVFGTMVGYGDLNFHFSPLVLISFVLPFSRAGDAFSVDSLRRAGSSPGPTWNYAWPVKVCQFPLVLMMFGAGIQKLTGNWLVQPIHNMEVFLRKKSLTTPADKGVEVPDFVLALTEYPILMLLMAAFMLGAELFAPLALFERFGKLRYVVVGALFLLQLTLAAILVTFPHFPWLAAYFFFVPWDRLVPTGLEKKTARRGR